jgi:hypothetical protein
MRAKKETFSFLLRTDVEQCHECCNRATYYAIHVAQLRSFDPYLDSISSAQHFIPSMEVRFLRSSLFAIRSSLFAIRYSLFAIRYSLFAPPLHRATYIITFRDRRKCYAPPRDVHFAARHVFRDRRKGSYLFICCSPSPCAARHIFREGENAIICLFVAPCTPPRDIHFAENALICSFVTPPHFAARRTFHRQCSYLFICCPAPSAARHTFRRKCSYLFICYSPALRRATYISQTMLLFVYLLPRALRRAT